MIYYIVLNILFVISSITARPFPIGFSISEHKVVTVIPQKNKDFAFIIPGKIDTYIYNEEAEYYKDYQQSFFAITCKKGGWDCLRHYEILANGCIPWFDDIDKCPPLIMHFLPKDLIQKAMSLPGVSRGCIDHSLFDPYISEYYKILEELIAHTRKYLTTHSMAQYLLNIMNYSGRGKILYFAGGTFPDYQSMCSLIGLKEILGDKIIDTPKLEYLYKTYLGDTKKLYGKGFTYTKLLDDVYLERNNIENRIKNKEFELIIYGNVHHSIPHHDLIKKYYSENKIAYICGQDTHHCKFTHLSNLFLREYDENY